MELLYDSLFEGNMITMVNQALRKVMRSCSQQILR